MCLDALSYQNSALTSDNL